MTEQNEVLSGASLNFFQRPHFMHRPPPLHALMAFEAAARLQSFAKAADELCVTSSAISHRIKLLEGHFGVQLFARQHRNMVLTAHGTSFLDVVQASLLTLQSIRPPTLKRKVVRVSVRPAFASRWLVGKLGDFHRLHEEIDLEIYATKLTNLKSVGADLAICYGKESEWPGYRRIKLLTGNLVPVCSPAYRNTLNKLSEPGDLLKAELLRLARHPWKSWFHAVGIKCDEPSTGPWFSDANLMLNAAANSQGVGLAFSALVSHDLRTGRLVELFDLSMPSKYAYYAVCSYESLSKPEVAAFINWLIAAAENDSI